MQPCARLRYTTASGKPTSHFRLQDRRQRVRRFAAPLLVLGRGLGPQRRDQDARAIVVLVLDGGSAIQSVKQPSRRADLPGAMPGREKLALRAELPTAFVSSVPMW